MQNFSIDGFAFHQHVLNVTRLLASSYTRLLHPANIWSLAWLQGDKIAPDINIIL